MEYINRNQKMENVNNRKLNKKRIQRLYSKVIIHGQYNQKFANTLNKMPNNLKNPVNPQTPHDTINQNKVSEPTSQISKDSISVVTEESKPKILAFEKHTISYFMLMISCCMWVGGFIYANENNMSPFETTISRYTIMTFVTYVHCRMDGSSMVFFNRPHQKTLFWRNIILAFHGFVVTIMQFYLPLSIFHTLVISGQVFIFLANYLLKGVKITKNQVIGVAISFIGLTMVINGRFFLQFFTQKQSEFTTDFSNYFAIDIYTQIKMGFLYVLWNALWAVSVVYTKLPEYSGSEMLFTQSISSMIIGGIGYLLFNSESHVTLDTYLPSILFCGMIMIANYLFTYGIMWSANTGISTMTLMSSAVIGYGVSIFRYNEQVNMISLLGTVVLAVSAGYVIFEQQKVKN